MKSTCASQIKIKLSFCCSNLPLIVVHSPKMVCSWIFCSLHSNYRRCYESWCCCSMHFDFFAPNCSPPSDYCWSLYSNWQCPDCLLSLNSLSWLNPCRYQIVQLLHVIPPKMHAPVTSHCCCARLSTYPHASFVCCAPADCPPNRLEWVAQGTY